MKNTKHSIGSHLSENFWAHSFMAREFSQAAFEVTSREELLSSDKFPFMKPKALKSVPAGSRCKKCHLPKSKNATLQTCLKVGDPSSEHHKCTSFAACRHLPGENSTNYSSNP